MRKLPFTIAEAAETLSISDKTVRRWLANGRLREQGKDDQGRILITADSVTAAALTEGHATVSSQESRHNVQAITPTITALGDVSTTLAQALRERDDHLIKLAEEVGKLKEQLKQRDTEIEQLRTELASIQTHDQTFDQVPKPPERGLLLRLILQRLGIG